MHDTSQGERTSNLRKFIIVELYVYVYALGELQHCGQEASEEYRSTRSIARHHSFSLLEKQRTTVHVRRGAIIAPNAVAAISVSSQQIDSLATSEQVDRVIIASEEVD